MSKNCIKYKDGDLNLSVLMLYVKQTFRQKVWVNKKKKMLEQETDLPFLQEKYCKIFCVQLW